MSSETKNDSDAGYDNRARVLNFLKKLGITDPTKLELTITPKKTCEPSAHSDLTETTVNYTTDLVAPTILNSGKDITEKYISQANNNINTLLKKDENFAYSSITNSNYREVIKALNNYTHSTYTGGEKGEFGRFIYPAFQYAYRFKPSTNEQYEKIYEANENHWYIPSLEEVNWIL